MVRELRLQLRVEADQAAVLWNSIEARSVDGAADALIQQLLEEAEGGGGRVNGGGVNVENLRQKGASHLDAGSRLVLFAVDACRAQAAKQLSRQLVGIGCEDICR